MTPRFTDDDERGFTLLPKDNYPVKVDRVYPAEKPDSEGRTFYKVEVEVISKDYASVGVTVNMSEHWMKHLLIHIMRATGMMTDMVVDPFFRAAASKSISGRLTIPRSTGSGFLSSMKRNLITGTLLDWGFSHSTLNSPVPSVMTPSM